MNIIISVNTLKVYNSVFDFMGYGDIYFWRLSLFVIFLVFIKN